MLKIRKKTVWLNSETKARIVEQHFSEGVSCQDLADFYNVCLNTIHNITKERRLELRKEKHLNKARMLRRQIKNSKPKSKVVRSVNNLVREEKKDQNLSVSWMSSEADAFITGMSVAYGLSRAQVVDKLCNHYRETVLKNLAAGLEFNAAN